MHEEIFLREDIPIADKHWKDVLPLIAVKEMPVKTTVSIPHLSKVMACNPSTQKAEA
jgi:hypothetical protein